ncbi:MAG: 5'-3' exonuclease H3TH domain-containing protein [Patescibacteria group bacterium]
MEILLLIDAHALIHRCFHALPPFKNKEGKPTGALYGLSSILIKILHPDKKNGADGINGQIPEYIVAFFDRPEPTFRKQIYDGYKAQRPKAPDELVSQIIASHQLFEAFNIKTFEIPGFEGDDLIGTAVEKFKNYPELKIIILTGDLDALQLIENERIMVETIKKGISETIIYNEEEVKNRFGILPSQIADYKGLVGDVSDNIKGVPGIGPKTAAVILQKYKTIENFFQKGREEKNYEKIIEFKDQSTTSKYLAEIRKDAPLDINIQDLKYEGLPKEKLIKHFETLGFQSLIKRL